MNHNIRNEIKSIIVRDGLTMDEVVNHLAERCGWSRSVPNFSGKPLLSALHRGSGAGGLAGLWETQRIRKRLASRVRSRIGFEPKIAPLNQRFFPPLCPQA
jgi:hypothetical protein